MPKRDRCMQVLFSRCEGSLVSELTEFILNLIPAFFAVHVFLSGIQFLAIVDRPEILMPTLPSLCVQFRHCQFF